MKNSNRRSQNLLFHFESDQIFTQASSMNIVECYLVWWSPNSKSSIGLRTIEYASDVIEITSHLLTLPVVSQLVQTLIPVAMNNPSNWNEMTGVLAKNLPKCVCASYLYHCKPFNSIIRFLLDVKFKKIF